MVLKTDDSSHLSNPYQDSLADFNTSLVEKIEKLKERHKSTEALEGSVNNLILHYVICSDDHLTTLDPQEDNGVGMPGCMIIENWFKFQAKKIPRYEAFTDVFHDEYLLKERKKTTKRSIPNVIRNVISKTMTSIFMVLFERNSFLFFLVTELCCFRSERAVPEFVLNMMIKNKDISLFKNIFNINIPMTSLLRYKDISTKIRLYTNVIRNDTYRMMMTIDMVGSEAKYLFGLERSKIFFDLLSANFCYFGSAGAISEFVPNMAVSTVRLKVISFFENACDMMNRLMTLLLRCPDSKILQQMPVQKFMSLMKSVIKNSLKTKTKGRKKQSLEGNIMTMVDSKEFEIALGEEIREDVLNGLRIGNEMDSFVGTRVERLQPSDRRENRPIHCIYFPPDCRLFIYIPTEAGSYWHLSDIRRANGISDMVDNCSYVNSNYNFFQCSQ